LYLCKNSTGAENPAKKEAFKEEEKKVLTGKARTKKTAGATAVTSLTGKRSGAMTAKELV
jgi:hypothetical protein